MSDIEYSVITSDVIKSFDCIIKFQAWADSHVDFPYHARAPLAKLHISHIRLHSAYSVRIPSSVNNFRDMLPTIRLSPLGSTIIRKYTKQFNAFKRRGINPYVSKCNV